MRRIKVVTDSLSSRKNMTLEHPNISDEEKRFLEKFGVDGKIDKEKVDQFFSTLSFRYETTGVVGDSLVRLDQEADIYADLEQGVPVLIRGNTRVGKTSMQYSLKNHRYKETAWVRETVTTFEHQEKTIDEFKATFCLEEIAELIAEKETRAGEDEWQRSKEVKKEIAASGKPPFQYLNDYLSQKTETAFLAFDEAIAWSNQPEKLEYLASLANFSQLKLSIVLHRLARNEELFQQIFHKFNTYFIRPLSLTETSILIKTPLENSGISLTEEAVAAIHEFCGGRAMEVNIFCRALFSPYDQERTLYDPKLDYTKADTDKIISLGKWKLDMFDHAIRGYESAFKDTMSQEEQALIKRLAIEESVPIDQINPSIAKPLIDTMLIRENKAKGVFELNGGLISKVFKELI